MRVAEFIEVETGKGSDALDRRPPLLAGALRNAIADALELSHDQQVLLSQTVDDPGG